jgi:hypothetical protein
MRGPHICDIPDEEVIEAARRFHAKEDTRTPEEALAGKWPEKLILCKMAHLIARGRLEAGVSLRTAWPTGS